MTLSLETENPFFIASYLHYLKSTKNLSDLTQSAYLSDLNLFIHAMQKLGYTSVEQIVESDLHLYLLQLKHDSKSSSTIARNIATLRSYFGYLNGVGHIKSNPALTIKSVRPNNKKEVFHASPDLISRILTLPNCEDKNGLRDRVIIHLISHTGIQMLDLISLTFSDVNLEMGYIRCKSHDQKRIPHFIPIDSSLKNEFQQYFQSQNMTSSDSDDERPLFGNGRGQGLTRQGIWKIIKRYGKQLSQEGESTIISPRHLKQQSF